MGELGNVGQASYASSKAGLIGLTRSLALELSPKHITVNLVSPGISLSSFVKQPQTDPFRIVCSGYVDTDFIGDLDLNQIRGQVPSGRIASPHDVAAAVHFLALSPSITGQNLFVDGGLALSGINFNN